MSKTVCVDAVLQKLYGVTGCQLAEMPGKMLMGRCETQNVRATCPLHFWQNERDLLGATAVIRGWNGYRNKSQHRNLTLEKKIPQRTCLDSNPRRFDHESSAVPLSYHRSPAASCVECDDCGP